MDVYKPKGLTGQELILLTECLRKNDLSPEQMLMEAENHLAAAKEAYDSGEMVNIPLANAIIKVFKVVVADWDLIHPEAQKWCLGMICYFSMGDDEIDDFSSPIGFEDDAEVVNACMEMIDRSDLYINTEDFENFS